MQAGQQGGGVADGGDEIRPAQQQAGLGQGRDGQAVPGGDDLVVPAGPGAGGAGFEQLGADAVEAVAVGGVGGVGGVVGVGVRAVAVGGVGRVFAELED